MFTALSCHVIPRFPRTMTTVSRQSAFWALMTLGLNVFTQDLGMVLGNEREISRAIRTCPLVCMTDSLLAIFEFTYRLWKGDSWRKSITKVALVRGLRELKEPVDITQCPTGECRNIKIEIGSQTLGVEVWRRTSHEIPSKCFCEAAQPRKDKQVSEERWWLRFILFTFGALPLTIKLLAMHGLPWM